MLRELRTSWARGNAIVARMEVLAAAQGVLGGGLVGGVLVQGGLFSGCAARRSTGRAGRESICQFRARGHTPGRKYSGKIGPRLAISLSIGHVRACSCRPSARTSRVKTSTGLFRLWNQWSRRGCLFECYESMRASTSFPALSPRQRSPTHTNHSTIPIRAKFCQIRPWNIRFRDRVRSCCFSSLWKPQAVAGRLGFVHMGACRPRCPLLPAALPRLPPDTTTGCCCPGIVKAPTPNADQKMEWWLERQADDDLDKQLLLRVTNSPHDGHFELMVHLPLMLGCGGVIFFDVHGR